MNSTFIVELGYVLLIIAVPVIIVSLLAMTYAHRNLRRSYWYGVLVALCVTALIVTQVMRSQPYHPHAPYWREVAGAIIAWAPVLLLPAVIVWPPARRPAIGFWVPIRAICGVLVSLPVGFILGLSVQ